MKIKYLGTCAAEGWPGLFCNCKMCETARERGGRNVRTRSQAIIFGGEDYESLDDTLLIDLPPDTYLHCLQYGLRLDKVSHLIVTHSHDDHFAPFELNYRGRWFANPTPNFPLNLHGNEHVKEVYDKTKDSLDAATGVVFHMADNFKPFKAGNFTVTPLVALHDRSERCLIYMIEHGGKRMLYGNDTGIFPEETWEHISGKPFDLVSLDCTNCARKEGTNHMGLPDALEVRERMEKIGCLKPETKFVLHHFSHNGGSCHDEMVEQAAVHDMDVSYDGGVWEF